MNNELKPYHKVLPIVLIPLSGLIIINFGWSGYATLTERPGLNGDLYYYYQLTRSQYYVFNFTVVLIALGLILFQLKFLIDKNAKQLTKTFWIFGGFIVLIIIAEIYLSNRFIGKG